MNFDVDVRVVPKVGTQYEMYCDGGCHNNGKHKGVGAWAWLLKKPGFNLVQSSASQGVVDSTNNRTEMTALLEAMKAAHGLVIQEKLKDVRFVIYSDSRYAVDIWNKHLKNWCGVFTALANQDLLQDLWAYQYHFSSLFDVQWVKGHDGNYFNEMVDSMCTLEIEKITGETKKRKKKV